jgi:hypothetical protein
VAGRAIPWSLKPAPLATSLLAGSMLWAAAQVPDDAGLDLVLDSIRVIAVGGLLIYAWQVLAASALRADAPPRLASAVDNPSRHPGLVGFLGIDLAMGAATLVADAWLEFGFSRIVLLVLAVVATPAICITALTSDVRIGFTPAHVVDVTRRTGVVMAPIAVLVAASFLLVTELLAGAAGAWATAVAGSWAVVACYRLAGRLLGSRADALGLPSLADEDRRVAAETTERSQAAGTLFAGLHAAQEARDLQRALDAVDAWLDERGPGEPLRLLAELEAWSWPRLAAEHARRTAHALALEGDAETGWAVTRRALAQWPDYQPLHTTDVEAFAAALRTPGDQAAMRDLVLRFETRLAETDAPAPSALWAIGAGAALETGDDTTARRWLDRLAASGGAPPEDLARLRARLDGSP